MATRIEMDLNQYTFDKAEFDLGQWALTFDDRDSGIHLVVKLGRPPASEAEKQENFEQLPYLIRSLQWALEHPEPSYERLTPRE